MSTPLNLPKVVVEVGAPVTSEQLDVYSRYKEIEQRDNKVREVLTAWSGQEALYREARKTYANWIVGALLVQAITVNVAFFLIGYQKMTVDRWVANGFILSVFGQMVSLTLIVFKHFFPSTPSQLTKLVENL